MVHSSPPRHTSSNMYKYFGHLNVLYSLREGSPVIVQTIYLFPLILFPFPALSLSLQSFSPPSLSLSLPTLSLSLPTFSLPLSPHPLSPPTLSIYLSPPSLSLSLPPPSLSLSPHLLSLPPPFHSLSPHLLSLSSHNSTTCVFPPTIPVSPFYSSNKTKKQTK